MRLLVLLALMACGTAAELTTLDGRTLAYDSIDCDPKRPKSCFVLKQGSLITTLKQSEIDPAVLPEALRQQLEEYALSQLEACLILYEDEWIDRDGHLLKTDPRFSYPKKLRAIGRNRLTLVNKSDKRLTIGIRPTGEAPDQRRGYELSVLAFKEKTIQLPDGEYVMLVVSETGNEAELAVCETDPTSLKLVALTLTYTGTAVGDGMRLRPVGTITVPENMRRRK